MKLLSAPFVVAALAAVPPVQAQTAYPNKTITIVVPTAAGGANDAMARVIAQRLGPLLGQTVIIDNKAGGNGTIASEAVARSAPDGHTLMLGYIATHGMNPALQWYAIFAPANTPRPIVDKLNKTLNEVLADKEIVKRMQEHGADVQTGTPEQLGALVKSELVKWKRVAQAAELTAD